MPDNPSKRPRSFSAFSSAREEADIHSHDATSGVGPSVEPGRGGANATPHEVTEVERRVLAHERILQALIGHLADDDAEILRQLKLRFGNGHSLGQYEQNYVSTDDYGDQFIRSIEQEVAHRKRRNPDGRL